MLCRIRRRKCELTRACMTSSGCFCALAMVLACSSSCTPWGDIVTHTTTRSPYLILSNVLRGTWTLPSRLVIPACAHASLDSSATATNVPKPRCIRFGRVQASAFFPVSPQRYRNVDHTDHRVHNTINNNPCLTLIRGSLSCF